MKLGIMQPYFLPYLGYWQLINCVDKFVLYDDVNFIKGGWINRNQYLYQGQAKMFNITMQGASSFKKINDIELQPITDTYNPYKKLLTTIKMAYQKAPMYNAVQPIIQDIVLHPELNLAKYIEYSIRTVCDYLKINTEIIVSSSLNKTEGLMKEKRVIDLCKRLNADTYINAIDGKDLYKSVEFKQNEIDLKFIQMEPVTYKQFGNEFVPYLSILDILMFNDKSTIMKMLNMYMLEV